ncbi:unnamed protein product [Allacma fusca]|uniref:Uncharacterized protein n=1 Tax=Allacma fusca TaxID=39272 RepID=A0A8J2K1C6_9HEXA|nr:unnamed protein product [Allacma fusca]
MQMIISLHLRLIGNRTTNLRQNIDSYLFEKPGSTSGPGPIDHIHNSLSIPDIKILSEEEKMQLMQV